MSRSIRSYGAPRITKDGVTVAKEIELRRQVREYGRQLVHEVADRTSYQAGRRYDHRGRARACDRQERRQGGGRRHEPDGPEARHRSRGRERSWRDLKKAARKVTSNAEIAQIGTISANGDTDDRRLLAEAMQKVGNDGVITSRRRTSIKTELEVVTGHPVRSRLHLAPFRHQPRTRGRVEMEDAYVLISEKKLRKPQRLAAAAREGRPDRPSRCSSSPTMSRPRSWRRSWSTSCAAAQSCRRERRRATASFARRSVQDIAVDDRRNGDFGRARLQARDRHPRSARTRQEGRRSTRRTRRSSEAPATRPTSTARIAELKAQIDADHVRLRSRETAGTAGEALPAASR